MADLPKGTIVAYYALTGAPPQGWLVCDGRNNTPDLRGKFIRGTGDIGSVGQQGGSDKTSLPAHSHSLITGGADDALRAEGGTGVVLHRTPATYLVNSSTDGGTRSEISTIPPYVDLIFIMKA